MNEEEKIELLEQFIEENDLWTTFEEFVINQGYTIEDLII